MGHKLQLDNGIVTHPTAANLGPLFDRAGARLDGSKSDLFLGVLAEFKDEPGLEIYSIGKYEVPTDDNNLAHPIAKKMLEERNLPGGLKLTYINNMKPGGLGTSGAGSIATVEAICRIHELGLTYSEKIGYARLGEPSGHPDNVVPGIVGGITTIDITADGELTYNKHTAPSGIVPGLVIPSTIDKIGGTAETRKILEGRVRSEDLEKLVVQGIDEDNFEYVRAGILGDIHRPLSVTSLRNKVGIYGVDVLDLNNAISKSVGSRAILTPSGAGPAMLVLAENFEILERSLDAVVKEYRSKGHIANKYVTPFI